MTKCSILICLSLFLRQFSLTHSQAQSPLASLFRKFLDTESDDYLGSKEEIIIGGSDVDVDRYPYQVGLMSSFGSFPNCGGSLIAPTWVLSAGHCLSAAEKVIIGRRDFSNDDEYYEEITIKQVIRHPRYLGFRLSNDALLIELEWESSFQPIKLDDGSADLSPGQDVTVIGWGATSEGGPLSDVLQEVEVDIVPRILCSIPYFMYGGIFLSEICARRRGKDSCQGDSGGPLIIKGETASEDVQVGIVSWGIGCALLFFPGVYARVGSRSIRNFIEDNVTFD